MQRPAYGQRAGRIARNRLTRFHAAITAFDGPRRAMTNEHASSPALCATFSSAKASPLPMVLIALIVNVLRGRATSTSSVWRARAAFTRETDFYAQGRRDLGSGLVRIAGEGLLKHDCDGIGDGTEGHDGTLQQ